MMRYIMMMIILFVFWDLFYKPYSHKIVNEFYIASLELRILVQFRLQITESVLC